MLGGGEKSHLDVVRATLSWEKEEMWGGVKAL